MSNHITHPAVDLQIVGGGLGGLIAANLALDAGLTVRLIEKQRSTGGRAGSVDQDGFTLNQGPHALYLSGELRKTLTGLGIEPTGTPPPLDGALGTIGNRTGLLPQAAGSMLRTKLIGARDKAQLAKIMARIPKLDTEPLDGITVDQWLADLTNSRDLRHLLNGLLILSTYNAASELASAGAAVEQLKLGFESGVLYLDHGWSAIVDALEQRLGGDSPERLHRVTAAVSDLTEGDGYHIAVTANALFPAANTLVAAGSPAVAERLLGLSGLVDQAGPPVEASAMDLGLNTPPTAGVHLGLDTGLYCSSHSRAVGLAPPDQTLISLARYLRPGGALPPEQTKQILLDHARTVGVQPHHITMTRYLHQLTVTWGMPLAERGGLAGRPTAEVIGRPGCYIAGDWVGGRGLLADATAASAGDAVAAVVADRQRRAATTVPL